MNCFYIKYLFSDDFDIMQKSSVNKNTLVVDKKNEKFDDSYPMSREQLMKINMNSVSLYCYYCKYNFLFHFY